MSNTIYLDASGGETEIRSALQALGSTGGTLVFPKNADITISKTIYLAIGTADITIDLNGSTLHQTGTQTIFGVYGTESPLQTVALGRDGAQNATITYDKIPTNITVGGWVKVTSDDALPGDHIDPGDNGQTTSMGQAAKVIEIRGNTVVLEGPLLEQDQYQTNVRATPYVQGQFTLKNGTLDGSAVDYKSLGGDLVHVRNLVGAVLENLTVKDGSYGVNIVNNVNALIKDIVATNLWGGVHSATSLNTLIDGLFAEHVGHGIVVHGTGSNQSSASTYGADIGLIGKNSVVYDAANSAYDFHSESRNGSYIDTLAFASRMFGDFRGIGNAFVNSAGAGNAYGIQFYEYGDGDGRNSRVDNVVLREIVNYAFIISNTPEANIVHNSLFESYGQGYNVPEDLVKLINTMVVTKVTSDTDVLVGTAGADKLLAGKGADIVNAGDGDDYIWGGADADILAGGAGHDRFAYNSLAEGGDQITDFKAGANGDVIDVSVLAARLGWSGDDFLADGLIRATQVGSDTVIEATDGQSRTTLATLTNVRASDFNMYNVQTSLSDTTPWKTVAIHQGTAGNDWLGGSTGVDRFNGSSGDDSYVFNDRLDRVVNEIANGGKDTIYASVNIDLRQNTEVENARLYEMGGNIDATGNASANTITGNTGGNIITGGRGIDSLYGRGGTDTFVFAESGAANRDSIWDFDANDKIFLSKSVFLGLDANADFILDGAAFTIAAKWGAAATGTQAQVIYNSASGIISYDADGAGIQSAQDIVYIGSGKTFVDASDILIA